MKNLKIYINPGVHPQFEEITNYPPKDVNYFYEKPKGNHNSSFMRWKRIFITIIQKYLQVPRIAKIKNGNKFDLLHSTRGILIRNKKPWIVDLESGAAFAGLEWTTLKKPIMKKIIRKYLSSPYCKKIIPQSDAAKKTLIENIDCFWF